MLNFGHTVTKCGFRSPSRHAFLTQFVRGYSNNSMANGFRYFNSTVAPSGFTSSKSFFSEKQSDKSSDKQGSEEEKKGLPDFMNQKNSGQNIFFGLLGMAGLIYAIELYRSSGIEEITFQEFLHKYLAVGAVKGLTIVNGTEARLELMYPHPKRIVFKCTNADRIDERIEHFERELGIHPSQYIPVKLAEETHISEMIAPLLITLLPVALLIGFMYRMQSGAGGGVGGGIQQMFNTGRAKYFDASASTVRFKDVAGCNEAKEEIMEFVDFLKTPEKFTSLGARAPKGALLVGPPGTGKTLLAKAVAGEAGRPFFAMSGADFMEMYVGVGASRVRDLFKQAREKAPCIIFIDEIDAVGGKRDGGGRNNSEKDATLNQLLVEMDGMNATQNIVILAATNRPDMLDKALTRPGRFDRQVAVEKPDLEGRVAIFHEHLVGKKLNENIDVVELKKRLASLTPGMVGADIANICNEAAIYAARRNGTCVDREDFENAIDRVMGGLRKASSAMIHKRIVAYHEAGHCMVGWLLEHADPVVKVSIVPRTSGALGFAQYLPEETALYSQEKLLDRLCMIFGGRVAEEIMLGSITTGASDDLDKATRIARSMVSVYGMSSKAGLLSFPKQDEAYVKPFSDSLAREMDEESRRILDDQYERCKQIIGQNKDKLEKLAQRLLEKENIAQKDIIECLGERPFAVRDDLKEYLSTGGSMMEHLAPEEKKINEDENKETDEKNPSDHHDEPEKKEEKK